MNFENAPLPPGHPAERSQRLFEEGKEAGAAITDPASLDDMEYLEALSCLPDTHAIDDLCGPLGVMRTPWTDPGDPLTFYSGLAVGFTEELLTRGALCASPEVSLLFDEDHLARGIRLLFLNCGIRAESRILMVNNQACAVEVTWQPSNDHEHKWAEFAARQASMMAESKGWTVKSTGTQLHFSRAGQGGPRVETRESATNV